MSVDVAEREAYAAAQTQLVQALVAGGPTPDGFDVAAVAAASGALARKRMRAVAKACPELRRVLGSSFAEEFTSWAAEHVAPTVGGSRADGLAFSLARVPARQLDGAAVAERLVALASLDVRGPQVRDRRGLYVAVERGGRDNRWVVVVKAAGRVHIRVLGR